VDQPVGGDDLAARAQQQGQDRPLARPAQREGEPAGALGAERAQHPHPDRDVPVLRDAGFRGVHRGLQDGSKKATTGSGDRGDTPNELEESMIRQIPDIREMLVVHRGLRRAAVPLPGLIAEVRPGDTARARLLAAYVRDFLLGLHHHHTNEDEHLWPVLLRRVDLEAELVLRMEHQHEGIAAAFERVAALLPEWERTAAERTRDELAAAFTEGAVLLAGHLDEEEQHILPLVEKHLTVAEWERLGEGFGRDVPKETALFFLGSLLAEAVGDERRLFLDRLPLHVRVLWHLVGRRAYRRRVESVFGAGYSGGEQGEGAAAGRARG